MAEEGRIVPDVVRLHAEQAAFFWAQRDVLMADDPPKLSVVAGIDHRLEANLDGLRIAGEAAWPFILQQYEDFPEEGELFVITVMAIEQNNKSRIAQAIEFGRGSSDDARGFVGALAWLPPERIGSLVRDWIGAADAFKRFMGVSALVAHAVDPNARLTRLLKDSDERVRAEACKLAGIVRRKDTLGDLRAGLEDGTVAVRLWAGWAMTELGAGENARSELRNCATSGGPDALVALRSAIKAGPPRDVRDWLAGLLKTPATAPLAVRGAGMLGDRSLLHWLIHQMRQPPLAEAAGAAFLELFPESAESGDLFSSDPDAFPEEFDRHFDGNLPMLPLAGSIKEWCKNRNLGNLG